MIQDDDEKVTYDTLNIPLTPEIMKKCEGVKYTGSTRTYGGGRTETFKYEYKTSIGVVLKIQLLENMLDEVSHPVKTYPYYASISPCLSEHKYNIFGIDDLRIALQETDENLKAGAGAGYIWTN